MSISAKSIVKGALALAIGGVLLVAQPFDRQVGSVLGVTTDEEPVAPVAFTATWDGSGQIRGGGTESVDGVTSYEGSAWRVVAISEATDPRLRGTMSIAVSNDDYSAVGGPSIYNQAFRIENEDGAWQQLPTTSITFPGDDITTTVGTFVGEGGYEGLIAVFEHRTGDHGWQLRGYIIEGQLPPPPEPVAAE